MKKFIPLLLLLFVVGCSEPVANTDKQPVEPAAVSGNTNASPTKDASADSEPMELPENNKTNDDPAVSGPTTGGSMDGYPSHPTSSNDHNGYPVTEETKIDAQPYQIKPEPAWVNNNLDPDNTADPKLASRIAADAAMKLGVNASDITFHSFSDVNWSDSAMGCPEPEMMYMMVITPGYEVVVSAEGAYFAYHTNKNGYFTMCKSSLRKSPQSSGGMSDE